MGGAGYTFTGENDAEIMHNSAGNQSECRGSLSQTRNIKRIFYSSSACMYPAFNQEDRQPELRGKLRLSCRPGQRVWLGEAVSERIYLAYNRNHGIGGESGAIPHISGPEGTWRGGREKAPAALCRKIAETPSGGAIEIWGDGRQTRSFLYVERVRGRYCEVASIQF